MKGMDSNMNGAIILSAGIRTRLEPPDPMQMLGSISVVQRLIMTFHLAGVESIVIVAARQDHEKLEKFAGRNGVVLLSEAADQSQMIDNAKLGLAYLQDNCDKVLITPVDIPLFSVNTAKALLQSNSAFAVPVCAGRTGHPLLVSQTAYPDIIQYNGDMGLRGAVRASKHEREEIEVADVGVYVHSEQFEECEQIIEAHNRESWRPVMKLGIAKESRFLGPGSWQLLSYIETTGSVRLACEAMKISYSKAWKLLNNLEQQAGFLVIVRKHGGKNGGETYLTEQGKALMEQFERFEQECNQVVGQIFIKHFGKKEEEQEVT